MRFGPFSAACAVILLLPLGGCGVAGYGAAVGAAYLAPHLQGSVIKAVKGCPDPADQSLKAQMERQTLGCPAPPPSGVTAASAQSKEDQPPTQ